MRNAVDGKDAAASAVAHAMQELGLPPALALGHKVVRVALGRWNHAVAQGADQDIAKLRIQGASPGWAGAVESSDSSASTSLG